MTVKYKQDKMDLKSRTVKDELHSVETLYGLILKQNLTQDTSFKVLILVSVNLGSLVEDL